MLVHYNDYEIGVMVNEILSCRLSRHQIDGFDPEFYPDLMKDTKAEIRRQIIEHFRDSKNPFPYCACDRGHHRSRCPSCNGEASFDDPQEDGGDDVGATQGCPHDGEPPRVRIRASMFFDGTGNNRMNIDLGMEYFNREMNGASWRQFQAASYQAGYSNVARLEQHCDNHTGDGYDVRFSIYVEGPGTNTGHADNGMGNAFGAMTTGIQGKVARGWNQLLMQLREVVCPDQVIECLHVDTFGFSRGAAGARHFVWRALKDGEGRKLIDEVRMAGRRIDEVKIRFVGLFDTVASHSATQSNDVRSLGLDAVKDAERVYHLASAEEHRQNFHLTDITAAKRAGVGEEVFLPGVHSDIGGSYLDNGNEDKFIYGPDTGFFTSDEDARDAVDREIDWLIDNNWYTGDELTRLPDNEGVQAKRSGIRNEYDRIPLHMMAQDARKTGVPFNEGVEGHYPLYSADIIDAWDRIQQAVAEGKCDSCDHWFPAKPATQADWIKDLRHKYFHFSAEYGGANNITAAPEYSGGDNMEGRRHRTVLTG